MKPKLSDYIALREVGDRLEGVRLIFGLDLVAMCEMLGTTKYLFNEVKLRVGDQALRYLRT